MMYKLKLNTKEVVGTSLEKLMSSFGKSPIESFQSV